MSLVTVEDFVAETLAQIVRGAEKAQQAVGDRAVINPPKRVKHVSQRKTEVRNESSSTSVEFELHVTAQAGSSTSAGVGAMLAVLSLGAKGASDKRDENVNTVRFSIRLEFPAASD